MVAQNKLETPPPDIVAEGTQAILDHMRTLTEAEISKRFACVRVCVCVCVCVLVCVCVCVCV